MRIISAVVVFQLPITCSKCGLVGLSQPIKKTLSPVEPSDIVNELNSQTVGSHFPIGWGSFNRHGHTVYDCPNCVGS
jgi:hypothetical protein